MSSQLTAIVIPCLNEEQHLAATCHSLGFGRIELPPQDALLIIVDNGSIDATVSVAKDVQRASPTGSVIIATEPERGYVPPRRRGNLVAMGTAEQRGVLKENLLIVQADADTTYCGGYIDSMSARARQLGHGVLIDARSEYNDDFVANHGNYIALCNEADAAFEAILSDQEHDLIVDDKACSYWASDYELWGGHQREFTVQGDEIHSETTRLYIRGKAHGASRALCDDALAQHSGRRVVAEPAYGFATAGFPRESSFRANWDRVYDGPKGIEDFCKESNRSKAALAFHCRGSHLVGLFQILTLHVRISINPDERGIGRNAEVAEDLPRRDAEVVRSRPGLLLEDVFHKVDAAWMANGST